MHSRRHSGCLLAALIIAVLLHATAIVAEARTTKSLDSFGAVGDGKADDTRALKAAANSGGHITGRAGAIYRISARIGGFASGSHWEGNGATIYMPAAAFDNHDLRRRYVDNAVGIDLSGQTSAPFRPNRNISFCGFKLRSEVADGRVVSAIVARNVVDLTVCRNEISGFPVGVGIRAASLRGKSAILHNHVHDFTDNGAWDRQPQITGIEVDQDRVNSIGSVGVEIAHNRVENIILGPRVVARYGYQTDGIHLAHRLGRNYNIHHNKTDNVGEGIDQFGTDSTIHRNTITRSHGYGIKLIHGASRNVVEHNTIRDFGKAAIVIGGSGEPGVDTADNIIRYNDLSGGDYAGAWAAFDTSVIELTQSAPGNGKPARTRITNNRMRPGKAKYALRDVSTGGGNVFDNDYEAGAKGDVIVSKRGNTTIVRKGE